MGIVFIVVICLSLGNDDYRRVWREDRGFYIGDLLLELYVGVGLAG